MLECWSRERSSTRATYVLDASLVCTCMDRITHQNAPYESMYNILDSYYGGIDGYKFQTSLRNYQDTSRT